jgi:hypothetical protein
MLRIVDYMNFLRDFRVLRGPPTQVLGRRFTALHHGHSAACPNRVYLFYPLSNAGHAKRNQWRWLVQLLCRQFAP